MAEDLKLPIIKEPLPPPKWLSMDDYARFVILNLKYVVDKKAVKKWKRLSAVGVKFKLG